MPNWTAHPVDLLSTVVPGLLGETSPWRVRLLSARDDFYAAQAALNVVQRHPVEHLIGRSYGNWLKHHRYPAGTAEDVSTGQSWYYHAHRSAPNSALLGGVPEHGHFHTFVDAAAIAPCAKPIASPSRRRSRSDCVAHLVGLSIGENGIPLRIFALSRRTSDEMMFPVEALLSHLHAFWTSESAPHALTGRWLSAVLRLFEPEVCWLLAQREHEQRRLNRHWLKSRLEFLQPEILASCPAQLEERLQLLDAVAP